VRRTGLVWWHKPNSVPAFARWRSFISLGFPSAQLGCDYYPRGSSRIRGKKRAGNPPSALSCTTWGFSCGSAYANARWALTPPFHPYPAPSWMVLGGIFSVTLSVTRDLRSGRPRFHGACCLPVFGLSSGKTSVKPATTRHD
jgi:hypothetical protein